MTQYDLLCESLKASIERERILERKLEYWQSKCGRYEVLYGKLPPLYGNNQKGGSK